MIDASRQGDGYTLSPQDRLEALEWAFRQAETWSDINDIKRGAPFRSLTKFAGPTAERACRILRARWQEIEARDRALDAARRYPAAEGTK